MSSNVQDWPKISGAPLTLEAIRELHMPASHYRVSSLRYEPGVSFPATGRAGRLYVLSGACSMKFSGWNVKLQTGMFADFPAGNHEFQVLGEHRVELVKVWFIPEHYRVKGDA